MCKMSEQNCMKKFAHTSSRLKMMRNYFAKSAEETATDYNVKGNYDVKVKGSKKMCKE